MRRASESIPITDGPRTDAPAPRLIFVNRFFYPDISATSQILTDLAHSLARQGLSVHVICSRQLYDDPKARLAAREFMAGIDVHRLPTARFGRSRLLGRALDYLTFYLSTFLVLLRLVRAGDVVVAKTDPPLLSVVVALAARVRRATLINWLQDVFPEVALRLGALPLPRVSGALLRALRNHSLRAAHCNIVLGERMRQYLLGQGVPAASLRIIENWAEAPTHEPPTQAQSRFRRELGLSGHFVVAYSGNLGRAHEYQTLLGAAELLRGEERVRFLMVGGGAQMQILRDEVNRRQLPNVLFAPYQPREALDDSLAAADVHLCILRPEMEGLIVPSKFYGIIAAGRPVIFVGDPEGEIAGTIRRHAIGYVVERGRSGALAQCILDLQMQPQAGVDMGRRARMLFESRYTLRQAAQHWRAELQRLGIRMGAAAPVTVGD
jgi:glycosyltransferase involved in cell wall biosynthesis